MDQPNPKHGEFAVTLGQEILNTAKLTSFDDGPNLNKTLVNATFSAYAVKYGWGGMQCNVVKAFLVDELTVMEPTI